MSAAPRMPQRPLTLLIAALGGQGGGVLTDWISHAARAQGLVVQATSTPGVSQRTGATTYYLEIAPARTEGAPPLVLGLVPVPGLVDVLVCSELLEAARMMERGLCTPQRTTLVASTNRVFTTREKIAGGDGRFDAARIEAAARELSRRAVLFDMDALRVRHRAVISAALFGAIGGSGALGLSRERCEAAIRAGGVGVAESLAAFGEAWQIAAGGGAPGLDASATTVTQAALPDGLARQVAALPATVAEFARLGAAQVLAYQDAAYAQRYLERVGRIVAAESDPGHPVAREAARHLAPWTCYEDIIRVAGLKARATRLARIRAEAGAAETEVVRVHDFFKPRAAEVADVLPRRLGEWLERRATNGRRAVGKGVTLQSSSFTGALALRLAAALRPLRPRSLRFAREQEAIERWLALLEDALGTGKRDALALARLPRELKGYGDTHAAGRARFERGGAGRADGEAPRRVTWLARR
jgi:indolepyruvate ferredoxin oxidoreductase beta subunit